MRVKLLQDLLGCPLKTDPTTAKAVHLMDQGVAALANRYQVIHQFFATKSNICTMVNMKLGFLAASLTTIPVYC